MKVNFLCLVFTVNVCAVGSVGDSGCVFPGHGTGEDVAIKLMRKLGSLKGKRLPVNDNKPTGFTYDLGICTSVDDNLDHKDFGAVQTGKNSNPKQKYLGKITNAEIQAGTNWILLQYRDGEACTGGTTTTDIMIICNPSESVGITRVIEENTATDDVCHYVFEVEHQAACSAGETKVYGLSAGSIICIIFFTVAGLYLIVGFLYQRFVVGAKGMEQFPNLHFWQDFGNLQADGCEFLCRTGRRLEQKSYKGIGDDQLGGDELEDDRDDHLLPM